MLNDRDRHSASGKAADILERIKVTQAAAEETLKTTQEAARQISLIGKGIMKVAEGFSWANQKVIEPVASCIPFLSPLWKATQNQYSWFCHPSEPFGKAVWRGCRNAANRSVNGIQNLFRSDKVDFLPDSLPKGEFSRSRAGIAALATAFALSPALKTLPIAGEFVPEIVSDHAVALLYEPPYDAARMGMTALFNGGALNKETIYLNGKNEIDPKNDVWSVGGCETKPGCTSDEAITFHIKPSLMHQAWSLATGRGPFLSDYVAVPIPNVPSKCEVTSYGVRWRVSKWLNVYPVLMDAHCDSLPAAVAAPLASPVASPAAP